MRDSAVRAVKFAVLAMLAIFLLSPCSRQKEKQEADLFEEGMSLEKQEKYEQAIENYLKALQQEPKGVQIHLRLAICYSAIQNFKKAEDHYEQAIKMESKNFEARLNYSGFLFKIRDFDRSLRELAWVAKYAGESPEAEIAKGLIVRVESARNRNEVIQRLKKEIQLSPGDPALKLKLGKAYIEEGNEFLAQNRLEDAKSEYKKATGLAPDNGEFHYLFAQLYDKIGESANALTELEVAQKLDPQNLNYLISLAGFYIKRDKIKEGKALLQKVIEIDPKSQEAEFAKRRLEEVEMKERKE